MRLTHIAGLLLLFVGVYALFTAGVAHSLRGRPVRPGRHPSHRASPRPFTDREGHAGVKAESVSGRVQPNSGRLEGGLTTGSDSGSEEEGEAEDSESGSADESGSGDSGSDESGSGSDGSEEGAGDSSRPPASLVTEHTKDIARRVQEKADSAILFDPTPEPIPVVLQNGTSVDPKAEAERYLKGKEDDPKADIPSLSMAAVCPPETPKRRRRHLINRPRKMALGSKYPPGTCQTTRLKNRVVPEGALVPPDKRYRVCWLDENTWPKKAKSVSEREKGFAFMSLAGSALPASVNEVPIADSHGGEHSMRRPWPLEKMGKESLNWEVVWHEDYRKAKGLPQIFPPQPDQWALRVPNAWVFEGNVHTCSVGLSGGACRWGVDAPASPTVVVERAVTVCDSYCRGYFHFTVEHLPRIALLAATLEADPGLSVILNTPPGGFAEQYLVDGLGLSKERIVRGAVVFARWLYYPQPSMCGTIYTNSLMLLRNIVRTKMQLPEGRDKGERMLVILAERKTEVVQGRRSDSRMPSNWKDVRKALFALNDSVEYVRPLGLKVADQIRLFNAADLVIGPHGANLANVMWMRQGSVAVEIASYHYGNMCYYYIAQRTGVQYRFLLHEGKKNTKEKRYNISVDEVVHHVRDVLSRYEGGSGVPFS
eukprot:Hpha_TRINITY_DN15889_c3_g3::TRINITY_DN15889_c3_g3_i1::g.191419::m.191419